MVCDLATSYRPTKECFPAAFEAILEDGHAAVFVASQDGDLIGYVHVLVHPAFHTDGWKGWVEELYVAAPHRGSGLGRELMAAAEAWARSTGDVAYMALATRRAEAFYVAIGYEPSATYLKKAFR